VTAALASLGRTEDIALSPSSRRVAIAALERNRVAVFDVDIASFPAGPQIRLTGGIQLSSPALHEPHGVDFVDDDTLVVASRSSGVAVFKIPPGDRAVPSHEVRPLVSWPASGTTTPFNVPGSVSVIRVEDDACEILVCNNLGHSVTRHLLVWRADGVMTRSEVLLQKYLDIPDGVSVSPHRRWTAVSNHTPHNVLLYESSRALDADSGPDGILRGVHYPHGLSFSADGRHLLVADAGAPNIHIYAQNSDEWRGVFHPVATLRVMTDETFMRGRRSLAQGGPKGLVIDGGSGAVALTSEFQPLAFFDLTALLQHTTADGGAPDGRTLAMDYELRLLHERQQTAKAIAAVVRTFENSTSWRITAPLRRLKTTLRRSPHP
jgi:hypothetical protein